MLCQQMSKYKMKPNTCRQNVKLDIVRSRLNNQVLSHGSQSVKEEVVQVLMFKVLHLWLHHLAHQVS